MTKRCELTLTDESLQAEIELLGDVIVSVSLMPRPMTEAELDEALGLSPIHDRDGSVVGVSTIARDMSETRKATEVRRSSATQENLLNTVMRSASIGIVVAGMDGSLQVVNRAMCDLLGYDEAWFLAHRLDDLVHPDEVEEGARDRARLIDGSKEPLATKVRLVRSDGATIWVSRAMLVIPGQDDRPDLLLVQTRNISAEHTAQQALTNRPSTTN